MNENLNEEMQNQNTAEDVEKLVKVRIDKLKELQEKSKNPFEITKYNKTHSSQDVKKILKI